MKRIHKGSFYKEEVKGEVIVMSIDEIERTSSRIYMFDAIILIDTLNPERVGTTTSCHAYRVKKVDLNIQISKIK